MDNRREGRLSKEFKKMQELIGPYNLFSFQCADLSAQEATEFLKTEMSLKVISAGLPGYLDPDEYRKQYPNSSPEKYLILYSCAGLVKSDEGEIQVTENHAMSIVLGYDFPAKPPILIWYTQIWHPNFNTPHVCTMGRPFAASVPIYRIVLTIGEMVQYRNYNLDSPLNHEAATWARQNAQYFPVDDRDLVDARYKYKAGSAASSQQIDPLVELIDPTMTGTSAPDNLVELED